MVHVVTSTVALVTCVLQVWPWLRERHPRVHRVTGRVYVFGGVYPAATSALILTAVWPFSPLTSFRDYLVSVLWLGITTYGFILAVRRRTADHRRWMLRSFAVTASVLLSPLVDIPLGLILNSQLDSSFAGSQYVLDQVSTASRLWLTWALTFIAVEWWLERDQLRRTRRA